MFTDFCEEAALRGAQLLEAVIMSAGVSDEFTWSAFSLACWSCPFADAVHSTSHSCLKKALHGATTTADVNAGGTDVQSGGTASRLIPVQLNPFRQPLGSESIDNMLPSCSNAFLFGYRPS